MSGALKKIGKKIKKVFKKVVKVVKKIVKSKIFKVLVVAAAIYFMAGAPIPGAMPAAAAATTTSTAAAAGASALAPVTVAPMALAGGGMSAGVGAGAAAASTAASTAATVASAAPAWTAPAAAGSIFTPAAAPTASWLSGVTQGQASLANGLLTTGGAALTKYSDSMAAKEVLKEKEREEETIKTNSETKLDVSGTWARSKATRDNAVALDETGSSDYESPISKLSNVEDRSGNMAYYNNATNSYEDKTKKKAKA